jgi:hypothetical protein
MREQATENNDRLDGEPSSKTRRRILAGQAKAILAIGATVVTSSLALAAPRPACLLRGSMVRTIDGEVNVETIVVGDQVVTAGGRSRPVEWVGKWQAQRGVGRSWSRHLRPVRIKRSALAPNVPYADLLVSQGHAIFIEGLLIPARELVNGRTILIDEAADETLLEYFHVKLASHDVILVNGAPAETLLRHADAASALESDPRTPKSHRIPAVCRGNTGILWSRARRAVSPLLGPQKLDVIHHNLARQALAE